MDNSTDLSNLGAEELAAEMDKAAGEHGKSVRQLMQMFARDNDGRLNDHACESMHRLTEAQRKRMLELIIAASHAGLKYDDESKAWRYG